MTGILVRTQDKSGRFALGIIPLMLLALPADASTFTFVTAPGAFNNTSATPVSDEAILTINGCTSSGCNLTVQLLNFTTNPTKDYQAIGAVQISFSNLNTSTTNPSVNTSPAPSYTAIDIAGNNSFTAESPSPANDWEIASIPNSTTALTFCADCPGTDGSRTNGNTQLVIGGPNGSNQYTGGNNISSHGPYLVGSGATYATGPLVGKNTTPTWTLFVPELTSS